MSQTETLRIRRKSPVDGKWDIHELELYPDERGVYEFGGLFFHRTPPFVLFEGGTRHCPERFHIRHMDGVATFRVIGVDSSFMNRLYAIREDDPAGRGLDAVLCCLEFCEKSFRLCFRCFWFFSEFFTVFRRRIVAGCVDDTLLKDFWKHFKERGLKWEIPD